jgi:hypothetical protein
MLSHLGFSRRASTYKLMVKLRDARLQALVEDAGAWSFGFGDAEASYGSVS